MGFNTYITSHTIKDSIITVNDDKKQGFWTFETTVVNPIGTISPIPAGSCVVTGKLASLLVISGKETADMEMVLAFSINNSFEWTEIKKDGKWESGIDEKVADIGLRGLHPFLK